MNFQLYRGNLHKVPDVPRRWPLSKPSIPLQVFKKALTKRQEALLAKEKFGSGEQSCEAHASEDLQPDDKDDRDNQHEHARKRKRENAEACGMEVEGEENLHCGERKARNCIGDELGTVEDMSLDGPDDTLCESLRAAHSELEPSKDGIECADLGTDGVQPIVAPDESNVEKDIERLEAPRTPAAKDEDCKKSIERMQAMELDVKKPHTDAASPAARRAELQEQLKLLQETKHELVQILKQVLISEESKRKNQGLSHYPAPNGTTGTTEAAVQQKFGSDMQSTDLEEGELDYTRNSGRAVVGSGCVSHLPEAQVLGNAPARNYTNQQPNKLLGDAVSR